MKKIYFIKEPMGRYFISPSAHHCNIDGADCSTCLFLKSCANAWTSSPLINSVRYTKEDAEKAIQENTYLLNCIVEVVPETFSDKAFEIFARIVKILMFWQRGKTCSYCGSKRLWTHRRYANEGGLSSIKATCARCHKDAWSWRS
ncbi:MAG: hypothetical protein WC719_00670 [Patescibacteria group bacterium]|jgi:hypothetical protein